MRSFVTSVAIVVDIVAFIILVGSFVTSAAAVIIVIIKAPATNFVSTASDVYHSVSSNLRLKKHLAASHLQVGSKDRICPVRLQLP